MFLCDLLTALPQLTLSRRHRTPAIFAAFRLILGKDLNELKRNILV
jgi:hypothetical protein